jgi:hypothetical protein
MDPLQILGLVLLSLFVLSLVTGKHSSLLALGALTAFLAVLVGVAHLIYAGFNPVVLAAVVAAGAALVILMRRDSAEEEDDVVMEEDCMKLGEGLKILPLDARAAIGKVLKKSLNYHELCIHTYYIYKGKGVLVGKDIVMALRLFITTPPEVAIRICRMLSKFGYPCAVDTDVVKDVYFKFKPEQTQPTATATQHI